MYKYTTVSESGIYQEVKSYLKIYPNFYRLIEFTDPIHVREKGWEPEFEFHSKTKRGTSDFISKEKSMVRTRIRLSDLILCNKFDLFATFTFSQDRSDVEKCKLKMYNHIKNQRDRKHRFDYIIVPEYHSDNISIHFHALLANYPGDLMDSGKKTRRHQTIYNITDYRSGFSTATKISDKDKVAYYIKKYITKDMPQFQNKQRYWCSSNLIRPRKIMNPPLTILQKANFTPVIHTERLTVYHARDVSLDY